MPSCYENTHLKVAQNWPVKSYNNLFIRLHAKASVLNYTRHGFELVGCLGGSECGKEHQRGSGWITGWACVARGRDAVVGPERSGPRVKEGLSWPDLVWLPWPREGKTEGGGSRPSWARAGGKEGELGHSGQNRVREILFLLFLFLF